MKRREFIKQSSLASGMLFVPQFLKVIENSSSPILNNKKLIVIQLKGGNDGLNTIIPYRNDIYYKKRKSLALHKSNILKLNDEIGIHKSLKPLKKLYNRGCLSIINNVGYPNPSLSHFRSTDIWQTASDSNEFLKNGWIGRYLDSTNSNPYNAIEVDETLSLMLKGKKHNGLAITDPYIFNRNAREPFFNSLIQNSDPHLNEHNLGYLYNTLIDTQSSAKYIYEKSKNYSSKATYPQNIFGKQMKTISGFINSGLETQIYYAALSGFDTHANQKNKQERLLKMYADCMEVFIDDLKKNNTFKDVLILTFSEFGRRVEQNQSNGTDHGAANNVFIMSKNLKKEGFYNELSNLENLDSRGNIKYEVDFREIYATILDKWLGVNDANVLNKSFSKLNFI